MIQTIITHRCTRCYSTNIRKNGTDYKSDQKFHCLDCNTYGTLNPTGRSYPQVFKELVLRAYRERASMRGIGRIFGIARQTLARWLKESAEQLPDLADTLDPVQANDVLELDELWSRIPDAYKKCCSYSDFWSTYEQVFSTATHQSVGKESGETSHVERWNNTLRQRLARFVRKTLSFSKSDVYHEAVLKLYLHYYNTEWCPIS